MSQTPKKIVSKRRYAKFVALRVVLFLIGLAFISSMVDALNNQWHTVARYDGVMGKGLLIGLGVSAVGMFFMALNILKYTMKKPQVVPLTRANTGDLPADESLVRASEQPATPQQDVLLRPAVETQKQHEEQLLRPS